MKHLRFIFFLLVAVLLTGKIAITVLDPEFATIQYVLQSDMEESSEEDDTETLEDDYAIEEIGSVIPNVTSKVSYFAVWDLNIPGPALEIIAPPPQG